MTAVPSAAGESTIIILGTTREEEMSSGESSGISKNAARLVYMFSVVGVLERTMDLGPERPGLIPVLSGKWLHELR